MGLPSGPALTAPPRDRSGTYREIDPPARLVFETVFEKDGATIASTHCTHEFIARGARTELVLAETGFPREVKEDRRGGWGRTLDNLVRALV